MIKRSRVHVLDIYKLAVGFFVVASPFLFAMPFMPARIDSLAIGALITVISYAALVDFADWEEWFMLMLGLWLVAAPWLLGFPHASAMHVHVGAGLLLMYLAGLELWLVRYSDG